jgi:hypothetical protein
MSMGMFKAGNAIFFQRNNVFEGRLKIMVSGKKDKNIVFSAYGKGQLPEIIV